MKKILVFGIIIMLVLMTISCSSNNSNNSNDNATSNDIRVTTDGNNGEANSADDGDVLVTSGESSESEAYDSDKGSADDSISVDSSSDGEKSGEYTESTKDSPAEDYLEQIREPQAGQLTAGEWNDNENYDFFNNVLNDNAWYRMRSYWHFINMTRYEFKIQNQSEQALVGVEIILYDEQGNQFTTGYTDNQGYAVLYPFTNMQFFAQQSVQARINYGKKQYEILDLNQYQENTIKVTLNVEAQPVEKVDIMFMMDTTGSMGDELEYIKTELRDVIDRVRDDNANNLSIRVSGNYYRDQNDQYVVRSFPFRDDLDTVLEEMHQQRASGGGDYPEAVVAALNDAIYNHQWRDDAQAKLLFLVLDAPPHYNDQNIDQLHQLIKDANAEGIRIIPVASSGVDKETEFLLRFLDVTTNGTYVFLTDHSGIGNSHLTPTIGYYQVEQLNNLLVRVINSYIQ